MRVRTVTLSGRSLLDVLTWMGVEDAPPPHLMTPAGCVKIALPDWSASISRHTLSAVSYE